MVFARIMNNMSYGKGRNLSAIWEFSKIPIELK